MVPRLGADRLLPPPPLLAAGLLPPRFAPRPRSSSAKPCATRPTDIAEIVRQLNTARVWNMRFIVNFSSSHVCEGIRPLITAGSENWRLADR
jgi:hypothetical protein